MVQVPAHVIFRRLDAEGVLLDLEQGCYFGLNESGRAMWEQLGTSRPLAEVHRHLLDQFEVAPERLWDDLLGLVAELLHLDLLRLES
jgi:hypothetical protein